MEINILEKKSLKERYLSKSGLRKIAIGIIFYGVGAYILISFMFYSGGLKTGTIAPKIKTVNVHKNEVSLSDYKGYVVILDFFGYWCPPCKKMIPILRKIQKKYKNRVVVIGIHEPNNTLPPAQLRYFMKKYRINYKVWYARRDIIDNYKVKSYPTMVVIDQKGVIKALFKGLHSERKIVKIVEDLLK